MNKNVSIIAGCIADMFYNNFYYGHGGEAFEGWCEDGDIFEEIAEEGANVRVLRDLMEEIAPHVDRITQILEDHSND